MSTGSTSDAWTISRKRRTFISSTSRPPPHKRRLRLTTRRAARTKPHEDEESWEDVKETLIRNVGMGSIPVIKVEDADFGKNHTLYLKHEHEGRDLQLEYAEHTLRHVKSLWERDVVLETIVNGKRSVLKLIGDALKIERP